jgi:hypothetical protein
MGCETQHGVALGLSLSVITLASSLYSRFASKSFLFPVETENGNKNPPSRVFHSSDEMYG